MLTKEEINREIPTTEREFVTNTYNMVGHVHMKDSYMYEQLKLTRLSPYMRFHDILFIKEPKKMTSIEHW